MAKTVKSQEVSPRGRRRFCIAIPLAVAFGFLCAYLASQNTPAPFWWTPLMWTIVTNRLLIGFMVGFAGAFEYHPVFRFRLYPVARGAFLWAITSVTLACGALINPITGMNPWTAFWLTILAGAVYGLIIDVLASKFAGEGKAILD